MCTSSGDKKMLTTVGDPGSDATGFTRVTRPSAGATTTFGSSGGTRCGSRKKYAIKAATIRNNTLTYHNPRIAVAILTNSGTRMNGIPSRTILNGFVLRTLYFVLGFFVFSQWSVVSCPLTKYKHQEQRTNINVKGDAQLWFHVPFNPKLGETAAGQFQWL